MNPTLDAFLAEHGYRVTRPRRVVFEALERIDEPITISALVRHCRAVDKVSVYRTIELFNSIGIVESVAHGWKQQYELAHPFRPHHHHLVCGICGSVEEIQSDALEQLITTISRQYSFVATGHSFEVRGICKMCATEAI